MLHGIEARTFLGLLAALCALPVPSAAQVVPVGAEFQISAYTLSTQRSVEVATDGAGNIVAVWHSYDQDDDGTGIFGRRFDSNGHPLGAEFQVSSYTLGYQYNPTVAAAATGNFVVAWGSSANYGIPGQVSQDGHYAGIFAQRFGSDGTRQGSEFQVSSQTVSYQENPKIAIDAGGGFLVAWSTYDGSYGGVSARRFASNGSPQGDDFQVNAHTQSGQQLSGVAAAGGGFVVVWETYAEDGSVTGQAARRYDSSGVPQGEPFQVNAYTLASQSAADVTAGPNGGFTVVWQDVGNRDGSSSGVFGRRFDSAGMAIGSDIQLNAYTVGPQSNASVAALASGDFLVAWDSSGQYPGDQEILAGAFRADGTAVGDELRVNQSSLGFQSHPEMAALGPNGFVVVWDSQDQDGNLLGVFGRRFAIAGSPVRGRKLVIRTPPSGTNDNKLVSLSSGVEIETPQNAGEDPRCAPAGSGSPASGARLRVVGSGGDFTIDLPCLNWTANAAGTRYRYRDGTGATCKAIVMREGRVLKAVCKGPQIAYTLGAPQGDVHVTLSTGDPATQAKSCATFGPLTSARVVRDGSDGVSYKALDAGPGVCQ